MKKKTIALIVSLVLVLGCAIGGTLAWLTDKTESVTNTFTVGDINITLAETKDDFKMVPGNIIAKDPKVTVEDDSEDCWLFVKVEESTSPKLTDYITYEMAEGWTVLNETSYPGVYYRKVLATDYIKAFDVIEGNQVTVKNTVTKEMMESITTENAPKLTFTAYACQSANVTSAAEAWAILNPTTTP